MSTTSTQQQLDEQMAAVSDRLTKLYKRLAQLLRDVDDAGRDVRVLLSLQDDLRQAQRAHAQAVHDEARQA